MHNLPDLLLPDGACLLHIGPHKTATSAVQSAFHAGRDRTAGYGVHYAAHGRHCYYEAIAAAGTRGRPGDPQPSVELWHALAAEVRSVPHKRVVVSSEMFDDADEAHARRIVEELGGDRVHVVVTLRPLARLLPSAWQQYVRNRVRVPYEDWLDGMLRRAPFTQPTPSFWRRNQFDRLIARWAGVVGADRLTVVMVDDQDPSFVLNAFEGLTGLPAGTLRPEPGRSNRSLTHGEVELFRRINEEFSAHGWSDAMFAAIARDRFLPALQDRTPDRAEPRLPTPQWAVQAAAARGAAMVAPIRALGVRVVGDLDLLGSTEVAAVTQDGLPAPVVPVEAAFDLMMASWNTAAPAGLATAVSVEERPVKQVRSTELVRVVGCRARRRVAARIHRARAAH